MLVDTGASVTILSQKFLNAIDPSLKPEIIPVNIKMKTATGEISSFLGQIAVELKFGKNLIKHKVLIANIPIEGILGMDFLEIYNRDVLLSKSCIRYRGNKIPCFKYKNNGEATCCMIDIYEKIVLPPSSETIVAGRAMDPIVKGMTDLVEPVTKFVEKHGLLIAKAVVQTNCGFIPIKFLNISDEEHALQKNTIAAQLEPIEIDMIEECHNKNTVNCNVQRETIQWPEHIKTIFDNNINASFLKQLRITLIILTLKNYHLGINLYGF
jgi:hypothetical protein